jgi:hypothetical protein
MLEGMMKIIEQIFTMKIELKVIKLEVYEK